MHFVFNDVDGVFVSEIRRMLSEIECMTDLTFDYHTGCVSQIPLEQMRGRIAYISPANSLLFFDGGIDKVYSEVMFPDLREHAKAILNTQPVEVTDLKRPYLPVGSAQIVQPTDSTGRNRIVITAPTMFLPQDVSTTENAYLAMRAVMISVHFYRRHHSQQGIETLVIPPLCCGYGKMKASDSAEQVLSAIREYYEKGQLIDRRAYIKEGYHFIDATHNDSQPKVYMNSELPFFK